MSARQLCIMACSFCRDPQFHEWLKAQHEASYPNKGGLFVDEKIAKIFMLSICKVASRNDLDTNHAAAQRFHQLVRGPFMLWKARQRAGV